MCLLVSLKLGIYYITLHRILYRILQLCHPSLQHHHWLWAVAVASQQINLQCVRGDRLELECVSREQTPSVISPTVSNMFEFSKPTTDKDLLCTLVTNPTHSDISGSLSILASS